MTRLPSPAKATSACTPDTRVGALFLRHIPDPREGFTHSSPTVAHLPNPRSDCCEQRLRLDRIPNPREGDQVQASGSDVLHVSCGVWVWLRGPPSPPLFCGDDVVRPPIQGWVATEPGARLQVEVDTRFPGQVRLWREMGHCLQPSWGTLGGLGKRWEEWEGRGQDGAGVRTGAFARLARLPCAPAVGDGLLVFAAIELLPLGPSL